MLVLAAGCGEGADADARMVERAVREQASRAPGAVDRVRCSPTQRGWGCTIRFRDGSTQACQAAVRDGRVGGAACQPRRGE